MPSLLQHEIEERIRTEFHAAINQMERASEKEKADAAARLKRAMRRLYDFVAYGKVPADLQLTRSA